MANIVFDFLHNYQTGERRESEPASAYQYDEGHVLEAILPSAVTTVELHYWIRGMEEAEAYTPTSITPNADGSCTVLGNIPNKYFETNGELRIYIVVTGGTSSITTYEGKLHICQRSMPDDYVDDDPENEATRILTEAREAAATATAAAQTAQDVADSIPADYSQMSEDVSTLKEEYKQFTQSDLYRGVWENSSSPTYWDKRICTAKLIKITAGDKFVYSTGVLQIAFGTYSVDGSTNNAYVSWHTVNVETEYVFDYDGYFFMQFKKADGSAVTISEYDASCKLYYGQNYTAYATKDLLRNTIGLNPVSLSWAQGGLSTTGETADNVRIRTAEYVLMPDSVHLHPKDGYKVLIYLYDSTYNVLSAGDWQTRGFDIVKTANTVYFRLAFAKTSNASISISEASNLAVTYSYDDLGGVVAKVKNKVYQDFGYVYYGLAVNNKHGYNARKILTISYAGTGTLNSIAVYGNYIVAIINGLNLLRIYDKTTKALLHELSIDLGHANNVGLGNKYNESDPIPLLYVEKEDTDGTYNVVRITSEWAASIIKKYTFPSEIYGHSPQVTWNFEDGVCYSIGYKEDTVLASNSCVFVRSNLNDEVLNEDNSYTPQRLFSCDMQKLKYMQDSKYYNGVIYLAHSSETSSSAISHVFMIDTSSGNIISRIPTPFSGEIEGVALYEDGGEIKMCATTYFDFYEMMFA